MCIVIILSEMPVTKCKMRGNNVMKIPETAAHHGWVAKKIDF